MPIKKCFSEPGHKSCSGWAEAQSSVLLLGVISGPDPRYRDLLLAGFQTFTSPISCHLSGAAKAYDGGAHPNREGTVLAANSTAAVRAAGLRRTPILLLLFEDFWVEFLKPNNKC